MVGWAGVGFGDVRDLFHPYWLCDSVPGSHCRSIPAYHCVLPRVVALLPPLGSFIFHPSPYWPNPSSFPVPINPFSEPVMVAHRHILRILSASALKRISTEI